MAGERGLVALRKGTEPWRILPPPSFDSLRSLRLLEDGSLIAGASRGRIYRWIGESWRRVKGADSPLDLRVFSGPRGGLPTLALGRIEVYLGPLLDPPTLERSRASVPLGSGLAVQWQVSSRPAEGANLFYFTSPENETRWRVIAPELRSIRLPDLGGLFGFEVIDRSQDYMYFYRALLPGFDINRHTSFDLYYRYWRSWLTTKARLAPD